jgi:hypothetical protein
MTAFDKGAQCGLVDALDKARYRAQCLENCSRKAGVVLLTVLLRRIVNRNGCFFSGMEA